MNSLGIFISLRNAVSGLKRQMSTFDQKTSEKALSSRLDEDGNKHSCHTCEDRIAGLSFVILHWNRLI